MPTFNSQRYGFKAQKTSTKLIFIKCSKNKTSELLIQLKDVYLKSVKYMFILSLDFMRERKKKLCKNIKPRLHPILFKTKLIGTKR